MEEIAKGDSVDFWNELTSDTLHQFMELLTFYMEDLQRKSVLEG